MKLRFLHTWITAVPFETSYIQTAPLLYRRDCLQHPPYLTPCNCEGLRMNSFSVLSLNLLIWRKFWTFIQRWGKKIKKKTNKKKQKSCLEVTKLIRRIIILHSCIRNRANVTSAPRVWHFSPQWKLYTNLEHVWRSCFGQCLFQLWQLKQKKYKQLQINTKAIHIQAIVWRIAWMMRMRGFKRCFSSYH